MKKSILSNRRKLTKNRVRSRISGTALRPRLSVSITNINVTAQLIDDESSKSLLYVSTVGNKTIAKKSMSDKAGWVGTELAKQANSKKVSSVVFDRGWRTYHGRVKKLAEAARKGGLKF